MQLPGVSSAEPGTEVMPATQFLSGKVVFAGVRTVQSCFRSFNVELPGPAFMSPQRNTGFSDAPYNDLRVSVMTFI